MDNSKNNVELIMKALGGEKNIVSVTNCMTRLRVVTVSESKVNEAELKKIDCVLGLVHDRENAYEVVVGPGKSAKYANICYDMGFSRSAQATEEAAGDDWKSNKAKIKGRQKNSGIKQFLKIFGDIFVPLIPGVTVAGLCAGFAALIAAAVPNYAEIPIWGIVYNILSLINVAFMTYITAWAGYRAAERFGGTPILGGMLGMITSLEGINKIAILLGLYNKDMPLSSILSTGKGGVLAAIAGVFILCAVEKALRKKMPDSLDFVMTPLLSLLICVVPYVLVIMPFFGLVSTGISMGVGAICMSQNVVVRIVAGYLATAVFLPLVAMGLHHGLVALYTVQLQVLGMVTLYPALAMAGAGQVGAALAIRKKAKKVGNKRLVTVINGALPSGFLGVGEPLIYGVTLPMGRPFITAGLGAGFGGAIAMALQVASTTWGPSGLLGIFVMTAGVGGPVASILGYLLGLGVSYVMGYIITNIMIKEKDCISEEMREQASENKAKEIDAVPEGRRVAHGDLLFGASVISGNTIEFTIGDPQGIHARPAGELIKLMKEYDSEITISTGEKETNQKSVIALMGIGAVNGTKLKITASGKDEQQALAAVSDYLEKNMQG